MPSLTNIMVKRATSSIIQTGRKHGEGIMYMPRRLGAEFFGTFWLTFAGCGSAVLAAGFPTLGIGFLGVSFAFGLTVLTMAYAAGHISGGHFNCAVAIGLWAANRFKAADVVPYLIAQVLGAIVAAAILYAIASGKPGWEPGGFASNGYGDLSPGKYGLGSCFLIEVLATFFFLYASPIGNSRQIAVTHQFGRRERVRYGASAGS